MNKLKNLNTSAVVRLVVYLAIALFGLVATLTGLVEGEAAQGWLNQAPNIAAMICGFLAAANVGPKETIVVEGDCPTPPVDPTADYAAALRDNA